ncbi:accessory Sec system glycosyltransferase Asp1, partial [Streptococcus suis]
DGLSVESLTSYLEFIFNAMEQNEDIYLSLVSYQTNHQQVDALKQTIDELLDARPEPYLFLEKENTRMFEFGDKETHDSRVSLSFYHSENEIIQSLESIRLIIDLADEPDLYTQIAGISSGIP